MSNLSHIKADLGLTEAMSNRKKVIGNVSQLRIVTKEVVVEPMGNSIYASANLWFGTRKKKTPKSSAVVPYSPETDVDTHLILNDDLELHHSCRSIAEVSTLMVGLLTPMNL